MGNGAEHVRPLLPNLFYESQLVRSVFNFHSDKQRPFPFIGHLFRDNCRQGLIETGGALQLCQHRADKVSETHVGGHRVARQTKDQCLPFATDIERLSWFLTYLPEQLLKPGLCRCLPDMVMPSHRNTA